MWGLVQEGREMAGQPPCPPIPPAPVSSLSPFNHSRWAAAVSASPAHRLVRATWERRKRKGGREGGGRKGGGRKEREEGEEEKEESGGREIELKEKGDLVYFMPLFPAGEQRPGLGSQAGQCQARWAYALDYYQDRRPNLHSRHGLINQFLSSNHMDISQLRGLASVGPARAALVLGQVPGQGLEKREVVTKVWWEMGLGLVQAKPGAGGSFP